jgi:hypothetical protein
MSVKRFFGIPFGIPRLWACGAEARRVSKVY